MRRQTLKQQLAEFQQFLESTKLFKITCRAKWFDEPLSLTTENVIQILHIRGKDEKDVLHRLHNRFNGKYVPLEIETL